MAESELPEVIVEDMCFFLSQYMLLVISGEYGHQNFFNLLLLLTAETVETVFVSTCQGVGQLSGLEVVVNDFGISFYGKQTAYVFHHLVCIEVVLHHLVSCIQLVATCRHLGGFAVWLGFGLVTDAECIPCIVNHDFELRM